jgi:hypothetical protein
MKAKIEAIAKELKSSLQIKELEFSNVINDVPPVISILKHYYEKVKSLISSYQFENQHEEITFFKEIKPGMFYKLICYNKIYNIELFRPVCGYEAVKEYLEKEEAMLNFFYLKNNEFIQYYRSGNTTYDAYYFLRNSPGIEFNVEIFSFERDTSFSTHYDFKATELLANDMLATYLKSELVKLKKEDYQYGNIFNSSTDKWTDTKSALVEIIYAIHSVRSVNNGNMDLKVLAAKFGNMFNTDMGDIYRVYLEIRARKGNRTVYLKRLIEALNKRMDEADNN